MRFDRVMPMMIAYNVMVILRYKEFDVRDLLFGLVRRKPNFGMP